MRGQEALRYGRMAGETEQSPREGAGGTVGDKEREDVGRSVRGVRGWQEDEGI